MATELDRSNGIVKADAYRGCGQWTVLEAQEIRSAVSTIDFDVSGYTEFGELRWDIYNLQNTAAAVNLGLTYSTDGGSSYYSSYENSVNRADHIGTGTHAMAHGFSATRSVVEIATGLYNLAYCRCSGWVVAYRWQETTGHHQFRSAMVGWQGSSNPGLFDMHSALDPGAAITDVRFKMASGNIDWADIVMSGRSLS